MTGSSSRYTPAIPFEGDPVVFPDGRRYLVRDFTADGRARCVDPTVATGHPWRIRAPFVVDLVWDYTARVWRHEP